jgi:thiamine-monophosphate kinase
MRINEWGENSFVHYLAEQFPCSGPFVGIGDDCAVIPADESHSWLVTTDALAEGIHFLLEQIPARDLGYKTVAVNVSDICAMGGIPQFAFLSIAMPRDLPCTWLCDFMQGVRDACDKWDLQLLGGDTLGSKRDLFINLTLIGHIKSTTIKYRHTAQTGDVICVTNNLGDSAGGFKAMSDHIPTSEDIDYLTCAHFRPEPALQQSLWLAAHTSVHAMMDISDGLNCDLMRILKSSRKGAVIETTQLPISVPLARVASLYDWNTLELALTGGEDYCLLLTVGAENFESIRNNFLNTFRSPLFAIGHVTSHHEELSYQNHGKPFTMPYTNFDHFLTSK